MAEDKNGSNMIRHYLQVKQEHPNEIVFYRLGDFYEMFFDDAKTVSRELELTLTGKDCGFAERAPMCGIPYHASSSYIAKLIEKGYRVAICEQVSDPKDKSKKLVDREVVQIITPGTSIDDEALAPKKNNYLASIYLTKKQDKCGVAWADISTGSLEIAEITGNDVFKLLDDLIVRISPSEIITTQEIKNYLSNFLYSAKTGMLPEMYAYDGCDITRQKAEKLIKGHFNVASLAVFDAENLDSGLIACGGLVSYLASTQMKVMSNITKLKVVHDENYVHLDLNTRRNLELTSSLGGKKNVGTLLYLLDETMTPMGARKLRSYVENPLRNDEEINFRLDSVEELVDNTLLRENVKDVLSMIQEIERKCSKISAATINPRECLTLADTIMLFPKIKNELRSVKSKKLIDIASKISTLENIPEVVYAAIDPKASSITKDGGYIKAGYNKELDEVRNAGYYGMQWLAEYEQEEKEKTGIKNLKTGFNRVFGYYIEVTSSQLSLVPDRYIRKQTTINSERYITPELKEMEYKILNSKEQSIDMEAKIFAQIRSYLLEYVEEILESADAIACLDALLSFAQVSLKNNYVKPIISSSVKNIKIVGGRHPVVESIMGTGSFSPNDTFLDNEENRTMLITGPNMAGKSTYMRQVAIITLMAHMGCFVPADHAEISIVDRVFTRVGASDDLAFGQSTFMVEMTEVANIVKNATNSSLIILDEVGRGTSTYDGLSIAWAIMEYLSSHIHAKTLFSTHYHELCDLEGKVDGIKNYRVMVQELGDNIIFLHKIARGSANRSFGIEVAKLAGLPEELTNRAKEILSYVESGQKGYIDADKTQQKPNYNYDEVINVLKEMDMNTISPIMAFGTLQNLVDKVKK